MHPFSWLRFFIQFRQLQKSSWKTSKLAIENFFVSDHITYHFTSGHLLLFYNYSNSFSSSLQVLFFIAFSCKTVSFWCVFISRLCGFKAGVPKLYPCISFEQILSQLATHYVANSHLFLYVFTQYCTTFSKGKLLILSIYLLCTFKKII